LLAVKEFKLKTNPVYDKPDCEELFEDGHGVVVRLDRAVRIDEDHGGR
jgi:hypothetical protein